LAISVYRDGYWFKAWANFSNSKTLFLSTILVDYLSVYYSKSVVGWDIFIGDYLNLNCWLLFLLILLVSNLGNVATVELIVVEFIDFIETVDSTRFLSASVGNRLFI
jgi:hypothetical protein